MEYSFTQEGDKRFGFGGESYEQQALRKDIIQNKIQIHQNIFLNNEVIDCNKVRKDMDRRPTEEGLLINNVHMWDYNTSPLFVLVNSDTPEMLVDKNNCWMERGIEVMQKRQGRSWRGFIICFISVYETLVTINEGEEESQPHTVYKASF